MKPEETLITLIENFRIFVVVKFLLLFFLTLYIFFAIVIIRQVSLMDNTFKWTLNPIIKLVAWLHLVAAILIWLYIFVIL